MIYPIWPILYRLYRSQKKTCQYSFMVISVLRWFSYGQFGSFRTYLELSSHDRSVPTDRSVSNREKIFSALYK